jgi:UDPglucose--hexose-1-phosphate uridylyltransferase
MASEVPHRRFNPLTGDWVLVSPERNTRPWQGRVENLPLVRRAPYDAECYLCPGNARAGGRRNPPYTSTFVFDNDFPALVPLETPGSPASASPLFRRQDEPGYCRVVCFSPRHDLTLPGAAGAGRHCRRLSDQTRDRGEAMWARVFENKAR